MQEVMIEGRAVLLEFRIPRPVFEFQNLFIGVFLVGVEQIVKVSDGAVFSNLRLAIEHVCDRRRRDQTVVYRMKRWSTHSNARCQSSL